MPAPARYFLGAARAALMRGVRVVLLLLLPVVAAVWARWGVVMEPLHGTDLHSYQAVGRAILAREPFYTAAIPGQFLLSPADALPTVLSVSLSDPVVHLAWVHCARWQSPASCGERGSTVLPGPCSQQSRSPSHPAGSR